MQPTTESKKLKVLSKHTKLSEAVTAAEIDLSYNEPLARRDIATSDKHPNVGESFVVELPDGKKAVFFVYKCDLLLLNRYRPFHSCLDDNPFMIVQAVIEGGECHLLQYPMRYSRRNRIELASEQKKHNNSYFYTSDSFQ